MKTTNAVTLGLMLALATPAFGQQRDTVRADTTRPFVRGGVYDKPYQTRLLGRTAIGGYAEAHARYERVDGLIEDSGFELKRFNLFTSTRVSDFVRIAAEVEIEEAGEEIKLEYAAIDVRIHQLLTVRGGMLLSPLGRFNLAHDSPLNEFTDRPLVSTEVLGVALSEPGFGVLGQAPVGRQGRLTWEAYMTNGFDDGLIVNSPEGTRIPLGRGNVEDQNSSPAFVGRLAWSPSVGMELGVSGHHGAWNVFRTEGTVVDERRNLSLGVVDGEVTIAGFRLSGEAALARADIPPGLAGIYASRQAGWYLDLVRNFGAGWVPTAPGSVFALKARFDAIDLDSDAVGQHVRQASAGVNFRPTSESVIKFELVRGWRFDPFNNRSDFARVLGSFATYF
ncbi:MAG TPA: hypothetical protein VNM36_06135 [Gemmatimonadaceae bacterium]|nr:hypothetical protein [Gemmatimonadaceae bacterium]